MMFLKRWRRASRQAKSEIFATIACGTIISLAGLCFLLVAYDPSWFLSNPPVTHRWLVEIFKQLNPIIRMLLTSLLAIPMILFGVTLIRVSSAAFRYDRWKPPFEDRSLSSSADER